MYSRVLFEVTDPDLNYFKNKVSAYIAFRN
jgi:hypothetical protein